MSRKSKLAKQQLNEAKIKFQEAENLAKIAEQEEEAKLESIRKNIEEIAKSNDMFCGIILTSADLVAIIDLALKSKENIKIPFALYFNE